MVLWIGFLVCFVLFNLFVKLFSTNKHSLGPGSAVGGKGEENIRKGKKKSVSEATSRAIVPVHRSARFALQFFLFHPCFVLFRLLLFFCRFLLVSRSSGTQKIKIYSVPR